MIVKIPYIEINGKKTDDKHLLDETESNIQFIASGQGNIGRN